MSVPQFLQAAEDGKVDELIRLLDSANIDIDAFDYRGYTALIKASEMGHEAAVRLLLTRGANVNFADKQDGSTALKYACQYGHLTIAELLLKGGADHSLQNQLGSTALICACAEGHLPTAELLLRSGADHSLQTKERGNTALICACRYGHLSIAELLLRSGADPSLQTKDGYTALTRACQGGHLSIAELLLRSGADHSHQNQDGDTALHYACYEGHVIVAEVLLRHGASYTCRNKKGKTPIEGCRDSEERAEIQEFIDALTAVPDAAVSGSSSTPVQAVPPETATVWDDIALEHAVQKAIAMKEKCWNRSKIMLVGQGRAGKSSLARVILGHDFNAESPSTCGMDKFVVNVSTGVVHNAEDSSQCQWQEYKEQGSHLNNALASMAQNISKQADARQDIPESNSVDGFRGNLVDNNSETGDAESSQEQIISSQSSSDSKPDIEPSPHFPPEFTPDSKSVLPQFPLPDLSFDISLIAKTQVVKDSDLLLSLFDFGGQEIFNCVHPFFLTENGAYLVVFNMVECLSPTTQQECLRFLMFWVNSIAMHTKRGQTKSEMTISDIFLVGTHRDQVVDKAQWIDIGELLVCTLSASMAWPYVIKEETYVFFPVDCTTSLSDPVARTLMHIVESRLKKSPFILSKRPLTWFSVLDDLEAAGQQQPMISLDATKVIAMKYLIKEEEVHLLLRFFREMGVLLWYEEVGLRDAVILDPVAQFIIPVTRIICDPSLHAEDVHRACRNKFSHDSYKSFRSKGVVEVEMLHYILSFGGQDATRLELMMKMYGLLVHWQPVKSKSDSMEGEKKYLVPSLFGGDETAATDSDGLWLEIRIPHEYASKWDGSRTFILVFSLDSEFSRENLTLDYLQRKCFLPSGIFEQLMCKALVWSQTTPDALLSECKLRKRMVQLRFGNVKFCMTLRSRHNCIQVDVLDLGQAAYSILRRLTLLVKDIIANTGCSLYMEPFVPARPDSNELFISTNSIPIGAVRRRDNLLRSASFDWIGCQSQQESRFDVFLSYRWNKLDSPLVLKIFDYLQDYCIAGKRIAVFHDQEEFRDGDAIRPYIFKSLMQTTVLAPIVSSRALDRMLEHDASKTDNLLFEWITSILFIRLRSTVPDKIALEKIMPTLLPENPEGSILSDILPRIVNTYPAATVAAVTTCFDESGINLTVPLQNYLAAVTVDQIITDLLGSIFTKGDDINDHCLPCRVAARAINALSKTDAFAQRLEPQAQQVDAHSKKLMEVLSRTPQTEEPTRNSAITTDTDPWSQVDVMSLLIGRLEKYRDGFIENQVTVDVLRECNLDDPASLSADLCVPMALIEAKMFITALKRALGRT